MIGHAREMAGLEAVTDGAPPVPAETGGQEIPGVTAELRPIAVTVVTQPVAVVVQIQALPVMGLMGTRHHRGTGVKVLSRI